MGGGAVWKGEQGVEGVLIVIYIYNCTEIWRQFQKGGGGSYQKNLNVDTRQNNNDEIVYNGK